MKLKTAMNIIEEKEKGFMIHFELKGGGLLHSDHFPDKHAGEDLFETEEEAWVLAKRFANATDSKQYVNIYVIDNNFVPVTAYEAKTINRNKL